MDMLCFGLGAGIFAIFVLYGISRAIYCVKARGNSVEIGELIGSVTACALGGAAIWAVIAFPIVIPFVLGIGLIMVIACN